MPTLEERLQRLEDIAAIRRLKHEYARTVDRFATGDEYAALFTEDGLIDGDLGPVEGREEIRKFFSAVPQTFSFFLHYMCGETIDIAPSGTEATGHWYLWELGTLRGEAVWIAITYDDEYRKVNGVWRISHQTFHTHFVTPYNKGWVEQRLVKL